MSLVVEIDTVCSLVSDCGVPESDLELLRSLLRVCVLKSVSLDEGSAEPERLHESDCVDDFVGVPRSGEKVPVTVSENV